VVQADRLDPIKVSQSARHHTYQSENGLHYYLHRNQSFTEESMGSVFYHTAEKWVSQGSQAVLSYELELPTAYAFAAQSVF
jgi:hypothetical protein